MRTLRAALPEATEGPTAEWLLAACRADALAVPDQRDQYAALTDVLGAIAVRLAPDARTPINPDARMIWDQLLTAADRLNGSGAEPLGRLPFVSDRMLDLLVAEAHLQLPADPDARDRITTGPGRALAALAISPRLCAAVGTALGVRLAPNRAATYMYDPPGAAMPLHVDSRGYEVVFHMVLAHEHDRADSGSALIVHRAGGREPRRIGLGVGDGVALNGRGSLHAWEPLGPRERRTLIGVGFARVS